MKHILRQHSHAIFIFLLTLTCYTYFFPRWSDMSQNSRLNMVAAVVDDGTLEIGKYYKNTTDYAKVDGKYYSDKAPGMAFLAIPVYFGLKQVLRLPFLNGLTERLANSSAFQSTLRSDGSGVNDNKVRFALLLVVASFLLSAVPTALTCVLLFWLLQKFTTRSGLAMVVALSYGLLSIAFAYANVLYGHNFCAFLLFASFYALHAIKQKKTPNALSLFSIGVLLGYSVLTEYPTALIVIVLFVYAAWILWRRQCIKQLFWVTLGGGICAAALLAYNNTLWGSPFTTGYKYSELWQTQHETGFLSLSLPHPAAMWGITFGLFRGLFVLSPVLLFAVAGLVRWYRSAQFRAEFFVCVACTLTFFLFNASSAMWWGGFTIGPRYVLPAMPFFATGIAFAFANNARFVWRVVYALCAVWSLIATWGLTLAEQAFPSDTVLNPLRDYALPNWLAGNIARNVGTLLGLKGVASLLPLVLAVGILFVAWLWLTRRSRLAE